MCGSGTHSAGPGVERRYLVAAGDRILKAEVAADLSEAVPVVSAIRLRGSPCRSVTSARLPGVTGGKRRPPGGDADSPWEEPALRGDGGSKGRPTGRNPV
jgi:hypothetical protein